MTILAWVLYAVGICLGFVAGISIAWWYASSEASMYSYLASFAVSGAIGAVVGYVMIYGFFVRRLLPGYKTLSIFFGGLEVWAMCRARLLFKRLVVRFAKNDDISVLDRYSTVFCDPKRGFYSNNWYFFWDTPHGIVLLCDGEPIACIGFVKNNVEGHSLIEIQQIQGMYGKKEELSAIRWERLLVTFVLELARISGRFREVCIQPAKYNKWQDAHRTNSFGQRYDGTARALKFKRDKKTDTWLFQLLQESA